MTIALVDLDATVYPIAWVAWSSHNPESYINRLEGSGTNFEDDPPHARDAIFETCKSMFEKQFKGMLQEVGASDYKAAIRGFGNYRERLYPEYKKSRKAGKTSPVREYVRMLDQWIVENKIAEPANGREADDLVRIWACQLAAEDVDYIVCATDKDLDCIPGRHFHIKTQFEYFVKESDAARMLYLQILSGDPTDNIPGLPRVGPAIAEKYLAHCKSEVEMQEVVVSKYFEKYPEDWYEKLVLNGSLIYIQETETSKFEDILNSWKSMEYMR